MYFNSWITWHYTQGIGKTRGFSPRHDDILFFTKHPKKFVFNLDAIRVPQKFYRTRNSMRGANLGNVWEFSHIHYCSKDRKPHPTQKPEALFERIILASSNEGDTVLDPFVGSGTSLRVCQQTNRNAAGIDINPDYIAMTNERLTENFQVLIRWTKGTADIQGSLIYSAMKGGFMIDINAWLEAFCGRIDENFSGRYGFLAFREVTHEAKQKTPATSI